MIKNMKPLSNRVLLQEVKEEKKTEGGLFKADTVVDPIQKCKVIAVGPGKLTENGHLMKMTVKPDDIVFIQRYCAGEAGDDHLIVKEDDILGTLESS